MKYFSFQIFLDKNKLFVIWIVSSENDLNGDLYGVKLFAMSSLLPLNYNDQIKLIFNEDLDSDIRYRAMGVNAGMERLVKMMKIGTLSSSLINQI